MESAARDQWYTIGALNDFPEGLSHRRLLGTDLTITRDGNSFAIHGARTRTDYGHLWVTLGTPERDLFDLPESREPDRRSVYCGAVQVRASGLRLVENFLDLAHFPYVHTDILGVEENPEVAKYEVEQRRDVDELWATKCEFFQPKAAASSEGGQISQYMYRVVSPFNVMLYKTPPSAPNRWDVIALFVQPVEPDLSIAHPYMLVIDDTSTDAELIGFQQMIFLQDKIVLENQRPRLLPLQPGRETPTRADLSSVLYRRWLKEKGLTYGTEARTDRVA
ncbi:MAG: aromatic ring-hydroxylating dioxygenase subunit alpha [Hyphomicrobiales bacterium]|nr:MAG: aromatic ring-hydroxylating dioxygenase subunit alpha [Hyphomicrobiales bacterium]